MKRRYIIHLLVTATLTCFGTDLQTRAPVYGSCDADRLTAWNSITGSIIYGTCHDDTFIGWDSVTHSTVIGKCR